MLREEVVLRGRCVTNLNWKGRWALKDSQASDQETKFLKHERNAVIVAVVWRCVMVRTEVRRR